MKNRFILSCLTLIFSMLSASLWADVTPSALFQDSAVLQRQKPLRIWGKAAPGETVKVTLKGKNAGTKADKDGKWRCDSLGCWYSGVLCQLNKVVSYTVAEWDWED